MFFSTVVVEAATGSHVFDIIVSLSFSTAVNKILMLLLLLCYLKHRCVPLFFLITKTTITINNAVNSDGCDGG